MSHTRQLDENNVHIMYMARFGGANFFIEVFYILSSSAGIFYGIVNHE